MSEWKTCQIGEISDLIQGLAINAQSKHLVLNDDKGLPLLRIKDLLEDSQEIFIDEKKVPSSCIADKNDLIFTRTGQVGFVFMGKKGVVHNNCFRIVPKDNRLHRPFLYYYLYRENIRDYLDNISAGSVQSDMTHSIFKTVEVLLPPLPEQRAIASVLSSLDDKIDLLNRQNKTLEAMAETLFRQWFVEEAEEGWEEGVLGDVIELVYGKGLKQEVRTGKGYPVVGSSGIVGYHSDFLVKGPGIVIGRKGTLGKVIYLFENFFPIDTTYYIKSKIESEGLLYEYFLLKTLNFEEMNSDSAVPGLNRDIALSTEIQIAPLDKLHKFNKLASAFITKLSANSNNIHTLEKLRDTLLPKLMSGEVRVEYDEDGVSYHEK